MSIELEADRIAWLTADGETITSGLGTFPAFVAESSDGQFDAGVSDVDGLIMLLATKDQIADNALALGSALTIRGASYSVSAIDPDEGSAAEGFATLYCEPAP